MAAATVSALDLAQQWLAWDQDATTRATIKDLLMRKDEARLESLMRPRIAFGTAGLRGLMEAGFSRMNSLTVLQASQGLAAHLLKEQPDASTKGIVIGHDHRHNSAKFADLTAAAFIAKGIRVHWFERMVHTPLVPFSVNRIGAAAGVMITASHNPAQDNGYKVYWSNACQIIPPHDKGIAAAIEKNLEPLSWDREARKSSSLVRHYSEEVEDAYRATIRGLFHNQVTIHATVFTAMHGIGTHYLTSTVQAISSSSDIATLLIPVPAQAQPDPDFPTVRFPNPEEPHALDMAIAYAESYSSTSTGTYTESDRITSVIAVDPDADRFAAIERLASGLWHQFTGNELGLLFASFVLEVFVPSVTPSQKARPLAMLTTTVSTGMLARMAEAEGFRCVETLTGFKWLGNTGQMLERDGYWVPFAFEEAIGYMFSGVGWDKDGVAAAAVWLAARAYWHTKYNRTPYAHLQHLYRRYGHHSTANTYIVTPSPAVTVNLFNGIRASGPSGGIPTAVGEGESVREITKYHDMTNRILHPAPPPLSEGEGDDKYALPHDSTTQMIQLHLLNPESGIRTRMTVRASGTESKIKLYVESSCAPAGDEGGLNETGIESDKAGEITLREAKKFVEVVKRTWFGSLL